MNDIDTDAQIAGINKEIWERFKEMYCSTKISDGRREPVQQEFEEITGPIDDKEAEARHRMLMAKRWFGYYRKCTDQKKKFDLIDQYNKIASSKERE